MTELHMAWPLAPFVSSFSGFFHWSPATLTHMLIPELPGDAVAPAFLQEGFSHSITPSGAALLTAPSVV